MHIMGEMMIEAWIDRLYRGKNMGGGDERSGAFEICPVGKII